MLAFSNANKTEKKYQDEIVGFSLDYDGCGEQLSHNGPKYLEKTEDDLKASLAERDFFKSHLSSKTAKKRTILYVGSNRQDCSLDTKGISQNGNGSCFENFKQLADEMRWEFNPLLLADIDHKGKIAKGLSINDPKRKVDFLNLRIIEYLRLDLKLLFKINIVLEQLTDISALHPDKMITFLFYDDDIHFNEESEPSILKTLQRYFTQNATAIPNNVHLFLMRYNAGTRLGERLNGNMPDDDLEYWNSDELKEVSLRPSKRTRLLDLS